MLVPFGDEEPNDEGAAGADESWMKRRKGPLRNASTVRSVVSICSRITSKCEVMTLRITALNSSTLVLK